MDRQQGNRHGIRPRGLSRIEAAAYIGVSPGTFDKLVRDGLMPEPIPIRSRKVWDRLRLDSAFESLAADNDNEWDDAPWQPVTRDPLT
ncbi:helix-turn-helix transcriptional regulator [Hoeflea sp.]|uniref:helix-turn-helix transcriptional regulator n=1 Tax=Hoeflea sp. TaxID=1940281 RepID=UPI003B01F98B